MKKRSLALLIVFVMLFAMLAACGDNGDSATSDPGSTTPSSQPSLPGGQGNLDNENV